MSRPASLQAAAAKAAPGVGMIDLHPVPADMERLVIEGLGRTPKQLPDWFLYDGTPEKAKSTVPQLVSAV